MNDGKFLFPITIDGANFYLELDSSMRDAAVLSKIESMSKISKELEKLRKQIDSFTENTPWKIAHEKRMNYYDKLDAYLDHLDFLKRLGIKVETT